MTAKGKNKGSLKMKYLILSDYLPAGEYKTSLHRWHERLRIRLAYWLFESVKRPELLDVQIKAGDAGAEDAWKKHHNDIMEAWKTTYS